MSGNVSRVNGQKGGRPKGSENEDTKIRREMKKRWLQRVSSIADRIFEAHEVLALGHYKEIETTEGKQKLYLKSPDGQALRWMLEHIWGKARQDVENERELLNALGDFSEEDKNLIGQALSYAYNSTERGKSTSARKDNT